MRTLITGVTGFAGSYLAREIAQSDPEEEIWGTAHSAASGTVASADAALPLGVQILRGDLIDGAFVRRVVETSRPDRVYHLAGFASGAGTDRARIFAVNVAATLDLLERLREAQRACRVLLASSGYVYGATTPERPAREGDPPAPSGAYAESKAAMEAAVRPLGEDGPLALTIVRSFNHTGPRQTTEFVVPAFARQIARIERGLDPAVVRVGNLEARRDFLDVRDVVRAYRLLLEAGDVDRTGVVNVCSGDPVAIRSLLDRLVSWSRVPLTVESDPARMRPSDLPENVGDPSRLREITGWRPEISRDRTLEDTLDWWRSLAARSGE